MLIPDFHKNKERRCSSVVEHVLSILETLGLILSSGGKKIHKDHEDRDPGNIVPPFICPLCPAASVCAASEGRILLVEKAPEGVGV